MTVCSVDGCDGGTPIVRGWCRNHYERWRRNGDPTAVRPPGRPAYLRLRIVDLLTIEDGWWTPEQVADRLDAKLDSVRRALARMVDYGLVEARADPLRYRPTVEAYEANA